MQRTCKVEALFQVSRRAYFYKRHWSCSINVYTDATFWRHFDVIQCTFRGPCRRFLLRCKNDINLYSTARHARGSVISMLPAAAASCAEDSIRSSDKRTACRSSSIPSFVFILCTYKEKQNKNETKGAAVVSGSYLLSRRLSSKVSSCPFSCHVFV